MKKVIIYTGDLCIHCELAMDLLNRKNIQFIEYNVAKDLSKREEMLKKIKWSQNCSTNIYWRSAHRWKFRITKIR